MNLFKTFVILISLSGYLGFFTNVQKNPLKALFPLNGLIILTLYLFGVNQKLDFGYYFLILFGILLFTFNCKFLIKFYYEKKNWCMYIIYAIPFFLLVIFIPEDFFYYGSDELYFWGSSVKWMYFNNKIFDSSFPVAHRFYPPGQQIFQYFFVKTFGLKDSVILKAQNYLILCNFLYIATEASKSARGGNILFSILVCLPFLFQLSYSNVMNELLLSSYISASIIASWKLRLTKTDFLIYLLSVLPILLLKNNAILFLFPILFIAFYTHEKKP